MQRFQCCKLLNYHISPLCVQAVGKSSGDLSLLPVLHYSSRSLACHSHLLSFHLATSVFSLPNLFLLQSSLLPRQVSSTWPYHIHSLPSILLFAVFTLNTFTLYFLFCPSFYFQFSLSSHLSSSSSSPLQ